MAMNKISDGSLRRMTRKVYVPSDIFEESAVLLSVVVVTSNAYDRSAE